jgi:ribosomal protein S18 acetylase RimI-like enzyme
VTTTPAHDTAVAAGDDHLPPSPLDNAGWHALTTQHASIAVVAGHARRYPHDVSPFFAIDEPSGAAWRDLASLAVPERPIVLFRSTVPEPPAGWTVLQRGQGHQMTVAELADVPVPPLRRLEPDDVDEMLALIELTKPGPFLPRTIELGHYFGVFDEGRLVAMAGERLHLDGFTEVSAVCTHPDARGRGLAAALTRHVAAGIAARGEQPFLHVAQANVNARRVYERLGFTTRRFTEFVALEPPKEGS